MRSRPRSIQGYTDVTTTAALVAGFTIIFVVPWVVKAAGQNGVQGARGWVALAVGGAIVALVQALAVVVCVHEAYWDARSRGERIGLNRPPALQGKKAPIALAVAYGIGVWTLARMQPPVVWMIALYAGLAIALLLATAIASRMGGGAAHREGG